MSEPICRFPVPELVELPEDVRARIEAVAERAGFVPNVFAILARRPEEFRAFFAYHDALMEREGGLTKAEREMIVVATSAINACLYCVISHGALVRVYSKRPLLADQVAANWREADLDARERAILSYACKVAERSAQTDSSDLEALRAHGLDTEDVWDIGAIAAFFAMSNRLANMSGMRPNEEFYMLGRLPRGA